MQCIRNNMTALQHHDRYEKRTRLIRFYSVIIIFGFLQNTLFAKDDNSIRLSWLRGKAPALSSGVSWGVPLPEGKIKPSSSFSLTDEQGKALPVHSWPLAYWPDGSLKWVGLSTVVDSNAGTAFILEPVKKADMNLIETRIKLSDNDDAVRVNTGVIQCEIPKNGKALIRSIKINGKVISSGGRLICILQDGPDREFGAQPSKTRFTGTIENVTVEQRGPVRAVVKIEGRHVSDSGTRNWLPFIVRLYFYAGQQSIRMVHTIIYDGNQRQDFIRGLGLVFNVPLDEQLYNRHIRFSGDEGRLWDEPCQPLVGRRPFEFNFRNFNSGDRAYDRQLAGERIAEYDALTEQQQFLVKNWASWNDFNLQQPNADGFRVQKRTSDSSAWIDAGYGKRSTGMAFVGDVSGGLALCVRDFWQSFPSALEICNVKSDTAQMQAWLWSPDAEAMDMRHYDTLAWGHNLDASYEDVQPGLSTAAGVARTSEIMLYVSDQVPSYDVLDKFALQSNQPPLLAASAEYIHNIPVLGAWSLPDRSTPGKRRIENQLDNAIKYYQIEVEQRHWYGFWNYGDIMHSYDWSRHVWRYDIGGFAWDNTELMPNLWLWTSYLRSGRADIFRMAEAMTRHNSEVDVYHSGDLKGLGSRHNVVHWGCGAKEVRISQAVLNRFFYYLTTDERTGDLMQDVVEASNEAIGKFDPVRLIIQPNQYPTHARVGPDWLALAGNWMTAWERTGDTQYRDRILAGVNSLYEMPYGFFSGNRAALGYNPETCKLYRLDENDIGFLHLSVLMGGPEVAFELSHLLQNKKWDKLWMQFCRLYAAPENDIEKEFGKAVKLGDPGPWYARLPAYYAKITGDETYAGRAWDEFIHADAAGFLTDFDMQLFDGIQSLQPVYEIQGVSTNNTAQWCLNAIELLELAGDQLPENSLEMKYQTEKLLYQDYFYQDMNHWIAETPDSPNSKVGIEKGRLIIDVDNGATVWFNQKLSGNIMIEYRRKVVMNNGKNDRLSDLNQFWMATDPRRENVFTRSGVFSEYDSLRLYYAGIGGNTNSTTRFRKYQGTGERTLLFDLQDEQHLLQPNKKYLIQIVIYKGTTEVFVDGEPYFSYKDDAPLTEGYFGFRTVKSHQEVDDFKVYELK